MSRSVTDRTASSLHDEWSPKRSGNGNIYYVATNGNDANDGSAGRPWRTPGPSSRKLRAGDTLIIRAGRYLLSTTSDMLEPPSGRPGAWVTIKGEDGARPTLAGRNYLFAAVNIVLAQSYVRVENLEITHDSQAADLRFRFGISMHGGIPNNILFHDLYIHHIDQSGISVQDVDSMTISDCRIEYCANGALVGPPVAHGGWRNTMVANCSLSWSGHYFEGGPRSPFDRPDGFGIEFSVGPVIIANTVAEHNHR